MPMIRHFRRTSLFVLCVLVSFLMNGGYHAHDHSAAYAFSTEDERILGEKVLAEVRNQHQLVNDPFANQFINELGNYLTRAIETTPFTFHFYIIKSPQLNAFAAPGGHVFFYTGIIEIMDRIDELAAVLCHELAHVSARHIAQRIEQSKKIGLATLAGALAGALIGGKAGGAVMTGSAAAGVQAQLHYSRNDERQADFMGFKYMEVSGFDPSGMITVLNKIQKGQWIDLGNVPTYLQTHPTGPERMAGIDILLSGYSPGESPREAAELKAQFPYFKAYLKAKYSGPGEAEQYFRKAIEENPDAAPAFFGLGVLLMERKEYEEAADSFEKALERVPHTLPVANYLEELMERIRKTPTK